MIRLPCYDIVQMLWRAFFIQYMDKLWANILIIIILFINFNSSHDLRIISHALNKWLVSWEERLTVSKEIEVRETFFFHSQDLSTLSLRTQMYSTNGISYICTFMDKIMTSEQSKIEEKKLINLSMNTKICWTIFDSL